MSDLRDDLTDIRGIGDAKADAILDVLDDHGVTRDDAYLEKALAAAEDGDDRDAAMYLRRCDPED